MGKSYLIESFGRESFNNCVVINFELQPQLKQCFFDLDPKKVISKLQLILGVEIKPEETLLFLDEIQECPAAIAALRYFKEKMPRQAVIGAGSLLEFAIQNAQFKMPVGRVHFLYLEPLSFAEFLDASGNEQLRSFLAKRQINEGIPEEIHRRLLDLLKQYVILGGMPAVLDDFFKHQDLSNSQRMQTALLQTFRSDFGKYAKMSQHKHLQKVFDAAPRLVGQRIKYANIDADTKARELKNALDLLVLAGLIFPVNLSKAAGLPLGAQINERKFKLNFLDVGIMQNACGLQNQISLESNLMQINAGAVAEQLVGQELRAHADRYQPRQLFFWARDQKGSLAEVDFVINVGANLFPVEVKAGKTGKLKSLRIFLQEKKARFGIRISQENLSYQDQILSVPLYMIEELPRLVEQAL